MTTQVANTILAQLGGGRFLAMTGAHSLAAGPDSLSFKLGRNPGGVSAVVVQLMDDDTYDVRTYARKPFPECIRLLTWEKGIYADGLAGLVASETGLALSL